MQNAAIIDGKFLKGIINLLNYRYSEFEDIHFKLLELFHDLP